VASKEYDLIDFLAWTASVIDKDGFVPRSDTSGKMHTMIVVSELLKDPSFEDRVRYPTLLEMWADKRMNYIPTLSHYIEADKAQRWASKLIDDPKTNLNSFLTNLGTLAKLGRVPRRLTGLAVSLLAEYRKRCESAMKKELDAT
jgi:hypothetical protein